LTRDFLLLVQKENPAVGSPGQIFILIGFYGFKYAAWLLIIAP
jgi:hypothetical protein